MKTMEQLKTKSMFEWAQKLWEINDEEMTQTCGKDIVLYLIYMKYCAILFAIRKLLS